MNTSINQTWPFKILYDGKCPICLKEINWLKKRDKNNHLVTVDIMAEDFDAGLYHKTIDDLMGRIHGVTADNQIVSGMEVFRQAYGAIGLGWLLKPTGWPLLKPFFDWGYRLFARNRMTISRWFGRDCNDGHCRL